MRYTNSPKINDSQEYLDISPKTNLIILMLLFLLGIGTSLPTSAQVDWVSFEDLTTRMREEPRPILVFIHTDWCKYCAMQEKNTFGDTTVAKKLNQEFYALKINAESPETIPFLNREYPGQVEGYHTLAEMLGKQEGKLIFPTTVILSEQFRVVERLVGMVKKEDFIESGF